jgi:hypothetical protein
LNLNAQILLCVPLLLVVVVLGRGWSVKVLPAPVDVTTVSLLLFFEAHKTEINYIIIIDSKLPG